MKKVVFILFWVLFATWCFPFAIIFMLISLWHWDWSYAEKFMEGLCDAFDVINPFH